MEIKIEKNVPIPKPNGSGRPAKYPWKSMEVGDSFFVNGGTKTTTLSNSAAYQRALTGRKFAVRTEGEGVRVWRIA